MRRLRHDRRIVGRAIDGPFSRPVDRLSSVVALGETSDSVYRRMLRRCSASAARASPPKPTPISRANSGVELLLEPLLPVLVGGRVTVKAV